MNPEVSKIGVYGMGGVGKTTIMTQIYNQLNEMKVFEITIWVTISSSFNLEKLQDNIAKLLGFQLPSSADKTRRAMELHEAFRRRRNFIIFLDDMWDSLSLQDVGIPEADRSNGSKIVWTTRSKQVCHSMESQKEIKVEVLTDREAWSLFKEKVGSEDVISTKIEPFARKVASECRGLPLALITVGHALRKEYHLPVWRNVLEELKTSSTDQIYGMDKYVFQSLRFSYSQLSSKIRPCFLYCALYPEDDKILVDELIQYWMAEGLIEELGNIQTEKDKGHAYLKELKDACMIESIGDDNEYVRMHDLIRDLAIIITKEQPLFMVKAGLGQKELPKEEEWVENLERVSLMRSSFYAFQGQPNCPQLSTLLLNRDIRVTFPIVTFSDTFFKHMHSLKVLDLSNTSIESLPASLSDLVNLRALILMNCELLKCLPSLAKLQKLRQLKLAWLSSLKELPHGLENLVKLRHLDISNIRRGNSPPSGALALMSCLEVLFMENSGWKLSYERNGDAKDNLVIKKIISLKDLTKFSANFADVLTFNSYINEVDESKLLKHFDYFLFNVSHEYDGYNAKNESTMKVTLPGTANALGISSCNFIQLSDIFGSDEFRQLIRCRIRSCNEMEWLINDGEIAFPSLETLDLFNLHSFKGLCKEKVHEETLKNLRHLFIHQCHNLKYVMPIDFLVNNLQNLEVISITDCNEIEDIISCNSSTPVIIPSKLKTLQLQNLPVLASICQGKLVCDSLCDIEIVHCPKLKKLSFLMENKQPIGMRIVASKEWWKTLEWEDPQLKELLQPFSKHGFFRMAQHRSTEQMIKIGKINLQRWNYWFP